MEKANAKDVFSITESKDDPKKSIWVKVGAAFVNKDGSLNAILDTYPTEGKLQIRDRKPGGKPAQ